MSSSASLRDDVIPGAIVRELSGGRLVGVTPMVSGGGLLWVGDRDGWHEAWTYEQMSVALYVLSIWGPGDSLICVLCECERGVSDPPGPWVRHQPSHRRRYHVLAPGAILGTLGFLEYVRP